MQRYPGSPEQTGGDAEPDRHRKPAHITDRSGRGFTGGISVGVAGKTGCVTCGQEGREDRKAGPSQTGGNAEGKVTIKESFLIKKAGRLPAFFTFCRYYCGVSSAAFATYFIAAVWLGNGLFAKVLDLVPRHRMIVGRILGERRSRFITALIGVAEIFMAVWILTGIFPVTNTLVQITVIAAMNIIEFVLARDLLLFGKLNALVAAIFITLVIWRGFFAV